MNRYRFRRLGSVAAAAIALFAAAGASADDGAALSLYHRFTIPAGGAWGQVAVELSPQAWRVGSPDGPPATERQLRSVLSTVGAIVIGGRCSAAVDGGTTYPCSLALRELDLAGFVSGFFARRDGDEPATLSALPGAIGDDAPTPASAAVADERPRSSDMFVGVAAPRLYLGNQSGAFGRSMRFGIRVLSNPIVASRIDGSSGTVVLRRGPPPAPQAGLAA